MAARTVISFHFICSDVNDEHVPGNIYGALLARLPVTLGFLLKPFYFIHDSLPDQSEHVARSDPPPWRGSNL